MSLINEALKKAQRQRNEGAADPSAPAGVSKLSQPRSAQSVMMLGIGAVVLVIISVGVTIYLVNRSSPPPVVATAKPAVTPAAVPAVNPITETPVTKSAPTPAAVPAVVPVAASGEKKSAPVEPATLTATSPAKANIADVRPTPVPPTPKSPAKSGNTAAITPPAKSASTPPTAAGPATPPAKSPPAPIVAATPTPAPEVPPAAPTPAQADERVHVFIDSLKITAVKAAGPDSRVFMNDRFFRINDIVERTLSLRLIKVEATNVTFSDANGVTYVKYF